MVRLTQKWSLRQDQDFFKAAKKIHRPQFAIFYQQYSGSFQGSVLVPKSAANLAVDRNKLKRRGRAILQNFKHKKGLKVALVFRSAAKNLPFTELKTEVSRELEALLAHV